ncbi:cytochrome c-type biogenesis protein [uncultured Cohaesibacter sp.]|uniref:cytochrome c-type biogenesis protein n=1 Tax=uncultured Cohaesibacter sp. TaxID=1002546 RepID=UPI00292D8ADA|nr:cytochrome c-type biogenesis protein [uncultured Cohaesibacter sp.]
MKKINFAHIVASCFMVVALLMASVPAFAVKPDEMLKDPQQESRARDISEGLRCLVCQNQSIDDSDAPLARDLRLLVRERITMGDSDAEVKSFLVKRYGEFVLLKPTYSSKNILLWAFAPLILLLGAMAIFLFYQRSRIQAVEAEARGQNHLSEEEQSKLDAIMSDDDKG